MSDVTRYEDLGDEGMSVADDGEWVAYDDYEDLQMKYENLVLLVEGLWRAV